MTGIAISIAHPNGVTSTFSTITQISWQPRLSANVHIGHYLSEDGFLAGNTPVAGEYFELNINLIDPTLAIPPQILSQLMAAGAPLAGGTIV